jgi:alpha-galactosidase
MKRLVALAIACMAARGFAETYPLAGLDLSGVRQGWGIPVADRSVETNAMSIGGQKFERGLGSHAPCLIRIGLDGKAGRFTAKVGVDDETGGRGSVAFKVLADSRIAFDSAVMKGGDAAQDVDVPLQGVRNLILVMSPGDDGQAFDHADWAMAGIETDGAAPRLAAPPKEEPMLLTPKAPAAPRINGPRVYGARPGSPFLYRIPCTGEGPIRFAAEGLPEGLQLDPETGIITGAVAAGGMHAVTLAARNARGEDTRVLTIAAGDTLALTPPMGWNSWYIHYNRVTEGHMRRAADAMIASGMADYGYQYVNIDDCWMKKKGDEPYRGENGAVLPNAKFPDIKGMVDHIHAKGLKAGLYTSPGPWTCAGYVGSWQHEAADAKQFAGWGFDFLKYDWCSYNGVAGGKSREHFVRPYKLMWDELRKQNRDIVLNLCQYGMDSVWEWGATVGNCWRTTGDLGLERGAELPGFFGIGLSNAQHAEFAKPGGWNDPDYILIGWVGDAHGMAEGTPTSLTPNEQYSYMSMWCLMASPLIFSGDMEKLDEFTLNVLCNHEVIAVDQDPLGRQAKIIRKTGEDLVMAKPMEDGSLAVGLFNLAEWPVEIRVSWKDLGLGGRQRVRDLWRQADLDPAEGAFAQEIPRHGVTLLQLWPL